ncbi:hypothetical protein TNCV_4544541 [Trichonephila clavipes]|nr:hypothetical protein TNCV_4544541 [Trichonephila clavipes]
MKVPFSMSARRCLGMTGNHNFPSGSKFFLQRIPSMNLNSSFLDEFLFHWISRKSVGVTMLLTGFIFYVKIMLLKSEGPSGKPS